MSNNDTGRVESLEQWSPKLFLLASVIFLVASLNYAVTFLIESMAFNEWVGLTVAIGRLVSLLAVAGLSVQLANRNARLGKLSRVVVTLAIIFTAGLLTLAILENSGYSTPIIAVFALGTLLLSLITYALFGGGLVRTGAYSPLVGGLLLAATGALLAGFFGQMAFPEKLIGTGAEGLLFVTHIGIWYFLRIDPEPTGHAEPVSEPAG